jgi:hypothetical protein
MLLVHTVLNEVTKTVISKATIVLSLTVLYTFYIVIPHLMRNPVLDSLSFPLVGNLSFCPQPCRESLKNDSGQARMTEIDIRMWFYF